MIEDNLEDEDCIHQKLLTILFFRKIEIYFILILIYNKQKYLLFQ